MWLVFVDETSDSKYKQYFGICCAIINSVFYRQIKEEFQGILLKNKWNPDIEFKGSYLFSATSGDASITIEKRIEIAQEIIELNTSKKNARIKFVYLKKDASDNHKTDYLTWLPELLRKKLPTGSKGAGKNVLCLHCDQRSDISDVEIRNAVSPVLQDKGFTLFENIIVSRSCFDTVGIAYADIVGYLTARVDVISNDIELFDDIPPEQLENNGKLKKLKSSKALLEKIKKLDKYEVVIKS